MVTRITHRLIFSMALGSALAGCGGGSTPVDAAVDSGSADAAKSDGAPADSATGDGALPDGGGGCKLFNGKSCPFNTSCQTGTCPGGQPVSCFCRNDGQLLCTGACPPAPDGGVSDGGVSDGGAKDGGADGGAKDDGCVNPNGGICPKNMSCVIGMCPDKSPITCFCGADGTLGMCTGACA
ncbi:MAG: hypothetical protein EXR72_20795 [Myxococcales bacterium]|nr:hypothetical protein [Myxococcales bacterium]